MSLNSQRTINACGYCTPSRLRAASAETNLVYDNTVHPLFSPFRCEWRDVYVQTSKFIQAASPRYASGRGVFIVWGT
jgi:hypothetical protein